jgi:hypothetical protein
MADAIEQDDASNVHDQAGPDQQAKDRGNTFPYPSESDLVAIMKANQKRRRQEWIAEKIRSSRVFWFFSSQVEEPRLIRQSRSTLDRGRYERFRSLVSWTHIARLQSSYAVKLGLTGLVVASLLATLFLYVPELKAIGFPKQFGFLFLSGLCLVLSSVLFRLRCPVLLLQTLSQTAHKHDSLRRKDLLQALVSTEFANLVTWRRYPVDLAIQVPDRH